MPRYAVPFSTYGVAEVIADNPTEATLMVSEGLTPHGINDAHWEYVQFDGAQISGTPEEM